MDQFGGRGPFRPTRCRLVSRSGSIARRLGYRLAASATRYRERLTKMARTDRGGIAGIGIGGALVIAGIVIALFWSLLLGIVVALVGLIAFGGFVKGKWY